MRITIAKTDVMTELDGVPARIWEGVTERGLPIFCLITRIGVRADLDTSEFEAELREVGAPCSAEVRRAIPLRMIL